MDSKPSPRGSPLFALVALALVAALAGCTSQRPSIAGPFTKIASGTRTCALKASGEARCWYSDAELAIAVTGATEIAAGRERACAIVDAGAGAVACWPFELAEKPDRTVDPARPLAPVSAVPGAGPAISIAVSERAACAVRRSGEVVCWDFQARVPQRVPEIDDALGVAMGLKQACAALRSGGVACWSVEGGPASKPARVAGIAGATAVTVGFQHACAITGVGAVACWGHDHMGLLGHGGRETNEISAAKVVAGLTDAVEVSAGLSYTCARRRGGDVVCWGRDDHCQLGTKTPSLSDYAATPTPVPRLPKAQHIAAGELGACALSAAGALVCWGDCGD